MFVKNKNEDDVEKKTGEETKKDKRRRWGLGREQERKCKRGVGGLLFTE